MPFVGYPDCANHAAMGKKSLLAAIAASAGGETGRPPPAESTLGACADYLTLLTDHGVQPSMSRVGSPYDNAKAESFIKTLKQEQVHGRDWRDLDALRAKLTTLFEITYNHQRLHSALNYQTPAAFEQQLGSVANGKASTEMTGARSMGITSIAHPRQRDRPTTWNWWTRNPIRM